MDKRTFLKTGLIAGAGLLTIPVMGGFDLAFNTTDSVSDAGFRQLPLPYRFDALEPWIDKETMEIHYSKHHAGYTKNLNGAVAEGVTGKSIDEIMGNISNYSQLVRNNGGGFYNHNFFWQCLTPAGTVAMDDSLMQVITRNFGNFDQFKEQFSKAASTVFGSGWAWLIQQDGKLKITVTPNQDNPLMDLVSERGKPLLALDVWEHAYYLKYQNKRSDYIASFWNIVNWDFVKQNLGI